MVPVGAPCMSMFPHGLGQHMYNGSAHPTLIPPQMSGENLYPRVEQLEAESEAKVTEDFLRLLESPEALKEMSGENLYPRVEQLEAESEAKVTNDLLSLLESSKELKEVEQADELASLLPLHNVEEA